MINIDNNKINKIFNKVSNLIGIYNHLVYFTHHGNHNTIFYYDLEIFKLNTLIITGFKSLFISNGMLYYNTEYNLVFSYDLIGNFTKEIATIPNHFFNISSNNIYYSDEKNHFKLTRFNTNLNIHEVINNTPCEFINVIDNLLILKSIVPDSNIVIYNDKNRTSKNLLFFMSETLFSNQI